MREILDRVPPAMRPTGFARATSILTHASAHVGRSAVLRLDLEDFFVSIPAARVFGVFRALGYPEEVSRLLTGLCTSRAPGRPSASLLDRWRPAKVADLRSTRQLPPTAGSAHLAGSREPLRLWHRRSSLGRGAGGGGTLHAVCRRSRLLRRRRFRTGGVALLQPRGGHRDRGRLLGSTPKDAVHAARREADRDRAGGDYSPGHPAR